jgi:hypothetical protein
MVSKLKIAKAVAKELNEGGQVASCYDKASSNLFKDPLRAIQDFGSCLVHGTIKRKLKRKRK